MLKNKLFATVLVLFTAVPFLWALPPTAPRVGAGECHDLLQTWIDMLQEDTQTATSSAQQFETYRARLYDVCGRQGVIRKLPLVRCNFDSKYHLRTGNKSALAANSYGQLTIQPARFQATLENLQIKAFSKLNMNIKKIELDSLIAEANGFLNILIPGAKNPRTDFLLQIKFPYDGIKIAPNISREIAQFYKDSWALKPLGNAALKYLLGFSVLDSDYSDLKSTNYRISANTVPESFLRSYSQLPSYNPSDWVWPKPRGNKFTGTYLGMAYLKDNPLAENHFLYYLFTTDYGMLPCRP